MAYGMGGALGLTMQQSFGTAYVTGMKFVPILSESLNEEIPPIISGGMKGIYAEGATHEGAHAVAGDIAFEVRPGMLGYFLKGCFGSTSYTATAVASNYFSHVFMPAPVDFDKYAALPPMTFEIFRDAGSAFLYSDCNINNLTLEYAHGSLLKATASIIGAGFATSAKQTASYEPFSEFTWDQTSISISGTANEDFQALTIKINNNLQATSTLDASKFPNRVKRAGHRTIEISGTILFISEAEANVFRAQTERRFLIVTKQGSNQLSIDLPSVRYSTFPVALGGPGEVAVGFSAAGKYNIGSGTDITVTSVITSWATY